MAEATEDIALTEKDFGHFAHASEYGCAGFWDHKAVVLLWNTNESSWGKGTCGEGYGEQSQHAEMQMLDKLPAKPEGPLNLYLSASPCSKCSAAIVKFTEDNPDLSVKIVFSSFYNVYRRINQTEIESPKTPIQKHIDHWEGLKILHRIDRITLKTFYGEESWKPILRFFDGKDDTLKMKTCNEKIVDRKGREETDQKIMEQLNTDIEIDEQKEKTDNIIKGIDKMKLSKA